MFPATLDLRARARSPALPRRCERFGTISWADALQPAIEHAERGLEVDWYARLCIAIEAASLAKYPASSATLARRWSRAKGAGDRERAALQADAGQGADCSSGWRRPAHATSTRVRRAAMVAGDLEAGGSTIRRAISPAYQPRWQEPLTGRVWRDLEINAMPGLSGGPSFLDAARRLRSAASVATLYLPAMRHWPTRPRSGRPTRCA